MQALVDGPSKSDNAAVPRHSSGLNNFIVTPIVIPKLPRAAGRGAVAKAWEKEEVESKWAQSAWAKRREQREKRTNLTDFDRFKVLRLKKQVSYIDLFIIHDLCVWKRKLTETSLLSLFFVKRHTKNLCQARFEVRKAHAKVRASAKAS